MSISPGTFRDSFFSALRISTETPEEDTTRFMAASPIFSYLDVCKTEWSKNISYRPIMEKARIVTQLFRGTESLQVDLIQEIESLTQVVVMSVEVIEDRRPVAFPRAMPEMARFIHELVCVSSYAFGTLIDDAIESENLKFTIQKNGEESFKVKFSEIISTPTFAEISPKSPVVSNPFFSMSAKIEADLQLLGFSKGEVEEYKHIIINDDLLVRNEIDRLKKNPSTDKSARQLALCEAILENHRGILSKKEDATIEAFQRVFSMLEVANPSINAISLTFKKSIV